MGTLTESQPINPVTNVQTALPPMSASRSSKPMGFNAYRTYSGGEMGMLSGTTLNTQQTIDNKMPNPRMHSPLKSSADRQQQNKLMQTQATTPTANNLNTNGNSPQKKKQVPFPLGTNSLKYNTNTQYKSLSTRASNMNADDFASKGMDLQNIMAMTPQATQDPAKVFLPNFEPTKCSLKPNGVIKAYAANTNQGIVRNYNEDRVSIILNMVKPPEKKHLESWPKCSFFGVYDGHGGSACAEYLRDHLHHFVVKDPIFPSNVKEAIKNGFYLAEKTFTEKSEGEHAVIEKSGSCAISILIIGEMCYAANVGDSRAIMSAEGGSKIYVLSRDHRPTDEQEQHRIVSNGGKIYQTQTAVKMPMFMMGTMGAQQQSNGSQFIIGPHRVLPGRLSVSRTFGDIEAKIVRFGGNPNVVVATPEIKGFKITQEHDFIILACDGIYDKMSNRDVINCVWETARKSKAATIHQLCGECVEMNTC